MDGDRWRWMEMDGGRGGRDWKVAQQTDSSAATLSFTAFHRLSPPFHRLSPPFTALSLSFTAFHRPSPRFCCLGLIARNETTNEELKDTYTR